MQFLLRVTPAAIESERQFEIPACVTIAQAILESATPQLGWGSSSLFRLANNPFGIKYCHFGPAQTAGAEGAAPQQKAGGQYPIQDSKLQIPESEAQVAGRAPQNADSESPVAGFGCSEKNSGAPADAAQHVPATPEDYGYFDAETWEIENGQKKYVLAQFQRFPNLTEAFRAHAFLLRGPRYQPAFAARADWKQFAERLGPKTSQLDRDHCGYSTNPSYSADLIRLVNLYRLNDPSALQWYATGEDPGPAAVAGGPAQAGRATTMVADQDIGQ